MPAPFARRHISPRKPAHSAAPLLQNRLRVPFPPMTMPSLPILRLKQLPSAEDARQASYQALVKTEWRGARGSFRDVGVDHEIRIFGYDSLNLINRLGLGKSEHDVAERLAETTDDFQNEWQVYRRPFAETLLELENDVTVHSEVLWERRSR